MRAGEHESQALVRDPGLAARVVIKFVSQQCERRPFAYGPTRSEMTGPTFVENTLIVSVQHPGEDCDWQLAPFTLNRNLEILDLNGAVFTQNRTVTCSSNWPSNIEGMVSGPPRPCVVAIQRKDSRNRFI